MAPIARESITSIGTSRIREVANAAMGLPDVLPFWFGEPDSVTPAFIREAAKQALDSGDTFYHHNLGTPPLRNALSQYLSSHHVPIPTERIVVTSSGVNGLMLAAQCILAPGDRVIAVTPLWPNLVEIPRILGAQVERVPVSLNPQGRWELDLDRLLDRLDGAVRALIVNSPNNPTGWTLSRQGMSILLEHCRRHGIWIISDEAYQRLTFDGSFHAPSMLDIASPDDRLIVANTFSKAWQMTGWRLGWLTVPPSLIDDIGKLVEFNTSCAPGFIQHAAVAALRDGEPIVRSFVSELGRRRDALVERLQTIDAIEAGIPDGGMYVFLRVRGETDSLDLAKRLVRQAGIGFAPGIAFGEESEGWLRWCFARPVPVLNLAADRLDRALRQRPVHNQER
jgi:aspartate/methionine/tyrosine aminotransferase